MIGILSQKIANIQTFLCDSSCFIASRIVNNSIFQLFFTGCLLGFKKAKHRRALNKVFPPPPLPPTFKPVHKFKTNDIIIRLDSKRSTLTSKDRAVLLGEQKPENTIKLAFDLMSEEDKKRIQCTKRKEQDTGAEKIRKGERKATRWDSTTHTKSTSIAFVPTAVEFSQESFKPFLKDPAKQKRYEIYLAVKKSGKEPDLSNDRYVS